MSRPGGQRGLRLFRPGSLRRLWPPEDHPSNRSLSGLLVLFGMTGFAISQPLLAVFGDNPELFAFQSVTGGTILWFAALVAFGAPLVLWGLTRGAAAIHPRAGTVTHLLLVAGLAVVASIQLLNSVITSPGIVTMLALLVASVFSWLYVRAVSVAAWARITAVLPALAFALFTLASPSGELALASATPSAVSVDSELPSVVFLVVDEFPTRSLLDADGGIDAQRFPNLAAFTEDAVWYRHFTAMAPFTNASVPSLLTGKEPTVDGTLWTEHPDNLFTVLDPTHELRVFETASRLCGAPTCSEGRLGEGPSGPGVTEQLSTVLGEAIDILATRVTPGSTTPEGLVAFTEQFDQEVWEGARPLDLEFTQQLPSRFTEFVAGLEPGDGPALHFLHLMLPHFPWRTYADGSLYRAPLARRAHPFSASNEVEWFSALSERRHLLQASYTDRLIGEMLSVMEEAGIYDDTVIVIVGDHGASFAPDTDLRIATVETLDSIAYTPLFIKPRGVGAGGVDDSNLMSVDLLPTVAKEVGLEIPWSVDGFAAGGDEIERRGGEKRFALMAEPFDPRIAELVTFDGYERFPRAGDRWIPPADAGDFDPSAPLWHLAGAPESRGMPLEVIVEALGPSDREVAVHIDELSQLRSPGAEAVPLGVVGGWITETVDPDTTVVIAVDGLAVAASPVVEHHPRDQAFAGLVPSGTFTPGERHDIQIALIEGDQVTVVSHED
jgi:hypothetical protein